MRRRRAPEPPPPPPEHDGRPSWAHLVDDEERPNREDLASGHNVFLDSMLSPVPLPKWLRGRRAQRERLR